MYFGSNLQYLRKTNSSMTQERLAERLGVSRQTVSKWEAGEAWPEIPKLLDLCEIFRCSLDELLRQDMAAGCGGMYPVRILRVDAFRMARYVMISSNPREDLKEYLTGWARRSGLADIPGYAPMRIGWGFPYVSAEQKKRFSLQGYAGACILPEGFTPGCSGPEIATQEAADYAVMTVREPFNPGFDRISRAYGQIMEFLSCSGIKKCFKSDILPCFEYVYEKNGTVFMDIFVHCDSAGKTDGTISFV